MVGYRRNKPGNPDCEFFLTMVIRQRRSWFQSQPESGIVRTMMGRIKDHFGIKYIAWVILPEHLHWLIKPGEADYSKVVYSFKNAVSTEFKKRNRIVRGEKLWQDRFWEHTVRNEKDRERCIEYIHYNPVKHGLAASPKDWTYSSFHMYVDRGIYKLDWAEGDAINIDGAEYDL